MKTLLLLLLPFIMFAQKADSARVHKTAHNDISRLPTQNVSGDVVRVQKNWSFGVLYVPYYSGTTYDLMQNSTSDPGLYSISENKTELEAELAYGFSALRLSLSAGYSSSYNDSRSTEHQEYSGNQSESGYLNTSGLKLLDFTLGLRYYFTDVLPENVSIFAEAGFGKQLAFAEYKNEYFSSDPPPDIINENNAAEFIEELNSPWHFNVGFGAEYFFSQSLSLKSNIRVLYSSVSGEYKSRYVSEYNTHSTSSEQTLRYFTTKIGLGLNFYF